jgi:hypothetical protein
MQPYQNHTNNPNTCTSATKVEALIPLVLSSDVPIVVLDGHQQPIGQIDRRTVMMSMVETTP